MEVLREVEEIKGISIVVPFLNEEAGILTFCRDLDRYAASFPVKIELLFVDDGSSDHSCEVLRTYRFEQIEKAKLVRFSRNYGSHYAIRAGVALASYGVCTWMGSDRQEPLDLLSLSLEKLQEGYDAVLIDKRSVQVSTLNRFFSKVYTDLMRKYAVKNYTSGGTSTIVFNQKIKDQLNCHQELNSSIMLQIIDMGYKTCTLSMDFSDRTEGKSKWTLSKKVKLFIDSFVSFSFMPIRLVSIMGCILFLIGLIIGLVTIVNAFVNPNVPLGYSTLACLISLGFGVTNISLGILAEYLWRTLDAARGRAPYTIDTVEDLLEECSPKA